MPHICFGMLIHDENVLLGIEFEGVVRFGIILPIILNSYNQVVTIFVLSLLDKNGSVELIVIVGDTVRIFIIEGIYMRGNQ